MVPIRADSDRTYDASGIAHDGLGDVVGYIRADGSEATVVNTHTVYWLWGYGNGAMMRSHLHKTDDRKHTHCRKSVPVDRQANRWVYYDQRARGVQLCPKCFPDA